VSLVVAASGALGRASFFQAVTRSLRRIVVMLWAPIMQSSLIHGSIGPLEMTKDWHVMLMFGRASCRRAHEGTRRR
jgi:hypothetical protein